jgi:UDP-N-acetylmuramoyl-L-alanyl-D-glutamate--2,6-diaminopimelate ligase
VGRSIADEFKGRVLRCAKQHGPGIDVGALSYASDRAGIRARISCCGQTFDLMSPLIGEHNLENLLIAIGCGAALGLHVETMQRALRDAAGAPGRLQRVAHPHDVLVFVDYAHTPDALARVLAAVRKNTTGRLIVTFGCGGDRDAGKRPLMGRASAELADIAVLTSDNPRREPPASILAQIEAGVTAAGMPHVAASELANVKRGYRVEADRHQAIRLALEAARPGDTVLIAGKGHERVQIVGEQRIAFDDVVEARAVIDSLPGGS